jgi:hypothetical protein
MPWGRREGHLQGKRSVVNSGGAVLKVNEPRLSTFDPGLGEVFKPKKARLAVVPSEGGIAVSQAPGCCTSAWSAGRPKHPLVRAG